MQAKNKDILDDLQEELDWGLERQDYDVALKVKAAIKEIKTLRAEQVANKWAFRLTAEECATINNLLDCLVLGQPPEAPFNAAKVLRELLQRAT